MGAGGYPAMSAVSELERRVAVRLAAVVVVELKLRVYESSGSFALGL